MGIHMIKVPDIGEGIAEVELVAWHVQPGDTVAEDQVLADVMTDKATVEIPSPVAGKVLALGGAVGQMIAVGAELIRIEVAGSGSADAAPARAPAPAPAAASAASAEPAHRRAPRRRPADTRQRAAPADKRRSPRPRCGAAPRSSASICSRCRPAAPAAASCTPTSTPG